MARGHRLCTRLASYGKRGESAQRGAGLVRASTNIGAHVPGPALVPHRLGRNACNCVVPSFNSKHGATATNKKGTLRRSCGLGHVSFATPTEGPTRASRGCGSGEARAHTRTCTRTHTHTHARTRTCARAHARTCTVHSIAGCQVLREQGAESKPYAQLAVVGVEGTVLHRNVKVCRGGGGAFGPVWPV